MHHFHKPFFKWIFFHFGYIFENDIMLLRRIEGMKKGNENAFSFSPFPFLRITTFLICIF